MRKSEMKNLRKSGAVALSLTLAVSAFAMPVTTVSEAAAKPKLASSKGTFLTGESKTVKIKNVTKKNVKKLTVSSTKKAVAAAKKSGKTAVVITAKKAGKATIKATVTLKNKKKYVLKYAATVKDYKDRKVTVYKTDSTSYKMTLRYYGGMPNIPYVRATEYYADLSGDKELKVEKTSKDVYLLTAASGETATVNTATDLLTAEHYEAFSTCRTDYEGEVLKNTTTNGAPFVKPLDDVVTTPDHPVTIDFSQYNLDLKGDTNDIWMPIETAANLFVNGIGATMLYTGNNIYHIASLRVLGDVDYWDAHYEYSQDYAARCPGGIIPEDLHDYLYNELIFMLDTNYGNPGRCYFADAIREKGFDRALAETDDVTRGVQKLLKSESLLEYLMGLNILSDMLFDGGHTWFDYGTYAPYMWLTGAPMETYFQDMMTDIYKYAAMIGYTPVNLTNQNSVERMALSEKKAEMGFANFGYKEEGDTAVYSFDSFDVDKAGWENYYKNGGELPTDTYGQLMKYLKQASDSGKIKNFILDVTSNGGGDEDSLVAVMDMIAGDPSFHMTNSKTGRVYTSPFKIDKNLDGEFDEKDAKVNYLDKFRFAILTSKYSFSCGNALPCFAKADGIMIIGERSGGGSCQTISTALGCGAFCMISRSKELVDRNGKGVDGGAEPDQEIAVGTNADGSLDYSAFYDISALGKYMDSFHK